MTYRMNMASQMPLPAATAMVWRGVLNTAIEHNAAMKRAAGAAEDVDHLRQMRRSKRIIIGREDTIQLKRVIGIPVLITAQPVPPGRSFVILRIMLSCRAGKADQIKNKTVSHTPFPAGGTAPAFIPLHRLRGKIF